MINDLYNAICNIHLSIMKLIHLDFKSMDGRDILVIFMTLWGIFELINYLILSSKRDQFENEITRTQRRNSDKVILNDNNSAIESTTCAEHNQITNAMDESSSELIQDKMSHTKRHVSFDSTLEDKKLKNNIIPILKTDIQINDTNVALDIKKKKSKSSKKSKIINNTKYANEIKIIHEMGFEINHATEAIKKSMGNIDIAVSWILLTYPPSTIPNVESLTPPVSIHSNNIIVSSTSPKRDKNNNTTQLAISMSSSSSSTTITSDINEIDTKKPIQQMPWKSKTIEMKKQIAETTTTDLSLSTIEGTSIINNNDSIIYKPLPKSGLILKSHRLPPPCKYFSTHIGCKLGSKCKFYHDIITNTMNNNETDNTTKIFNKNTYENPNSLATTSIAVNTYSNSNNMNNHFIYTKDGMILQQDLLTNNNTNNSTTTNQFVSNSMNDIQNVKLYSDILANNHSQQTKSQQLPQIHYIYEKGVLKPLYNGIK